MKEKIFIKKDFLDANNNGNVLVLGLIILQLIVMIGINFSLNLDHLLKLNSIDPSFECMKIKVIQQIKEDFYKGKTNDFEIEDENYQVNISYQGNECNVYFEGKHNVKMHIVYDDVYLCIASIEYDYSNWE